jgi:hypothetical protein
VFGQQIGWTGGKLTSYRTVVGEIIFFITQEPECKHVVVEEEICGPYEDRGRPRSCQWGGRVVQHTGDVGQDRIDLDVKL